MKPVLLPAAFMIAAGCLLGCAGTPPAPDHARWTISVLSSEPEYVSGGDARIAVTSHDGRRERPEFWLNGARIAPTMARNGDRLEGVVSGLVLGKNRLELRLPDKGEQRGEPRVAAAIVLVNHPVTGPMFTGPQQQPFICRTEESGLGQPLVDNQAGIGHPVFDARRVLVGYSRYCSIPTTTRYLYFTGSAFRPFDPATGFDTPPPDLATTTVNGVRLPFVVRLEAGTINRFIYTAAMLAPYRETAQPNDAAWNRKLVYWLKGGVGIGHQQGLALWLNNRLGGGERQLLPRLLAQGYAIINSTGNETGVHYNLRLAEETAMMTKERFIETHGVPRYTIGAGASGGAVQQYIFGQNRPGLIDGGVAIQSYPDMITQTTPISDCPLLGQYFRDEVALDPASPWARWSRQRLIEGMNASDTVINRFTGTPGTTECINGWWNAIPTVLNPRYKDPEYDERARQYGYPPDVFADVKWTHWNDLANIYGADSRGYAPVSIDNVGVQYGLAALTGGHIDTEEFLRINACVGGWREQPDYVPWLVREDPFDSRNMLRSASCRDPEGVPAPRRSADLAAIRRAYASGHVFTGRRLGIPLVDLRPYLEPQLDMHNSRQSFSARARLLDANAHAARRQVIWFTGLEADLAPKALDALAVIDRLLDTGSAPAGFTDSCFALDGSLIASGQAAWAGILDARAPGACTLAYPLHASPRMVAGESIKGDIFKCARKPVARALRDGTYGTVRFTPRQRRRLERIFPDGVCDYDRPGLGQPPR